MEFFYFQSLGLKVTQAALLFSTVDGYLLTGSLDKKFIVKVRSFSSAKTEDMHDYLKPTKRDFDPNMFSFHVRKNNLSTNDSTCLK